MPIGDPSGSIELLTSPQPVQIDPRLFKGTESQVPELSPRSLMDSLVDGRGVVRLVSFPPGQVCFSCNQFRPENCSYRNCFFPLEKKTEMGWTMDNG